MKQNNRAVEITFFEFFMQPVGKLNPIQGGQGIGQYVCIISGVNSSIHSDKLCKTCVTPMSILVQPTATATSQDSGNCNQEAGPGVQSRKQNKSNTTPTTAEASSMHAACVTIALSRSSRPGQGQVRRVPQNQA